jgi:hypothetical protein
MVRVHVFVEGQTEKMFVQSILSPHFAQHETYLFPRQLGKPKHKRGICDYALARRDILAMLKQEPASFCTTMFDYYGMPDSWPNRAMARQRPFGEKPSTIEDAVLADIAAELGAAFDPGRLIPYVQMHEFEALLFSDTKVLAEGLKLPGDASVQAIRDQFRTPEEINDSEQTAPSKRIHNLNEGYAKVRHGILISQDIGLDVMRAECPHFNEWIAKLEAVAGG